MYRIVCLLCLSLIWTSCSRKAENPPALPYYNTPDFAPIFLPHGTHPATAIPHTTGTFLLYNQDSIRVTENLVKGKIHLANFMFTSCGSICPTMTRNMKIISDSLSSDTGVVLLSFTVMPWIDNPTVLKKYKQTNGINNPNWHFLTGAKSSVYSLARRSYFAEEAIGYTKDSSEFLHTEHIILADKNQRIRGIYNGTLLLEMQHLLDDIRTLQLEAPAMR